eukprot:Pgem_evm1s17860
MSADEIASMACAFFQTFADEDCSNGVTWTMFYKKTTGKEYSNLTSQQIAKRLSIVPLEKSSSQKSIDSITPSETTVQS